MHIETIITCVGYADFLAITLPETKRWFKAITVLTSPDDSETIAFAKHEGVELYITGVWHENGATFNKAAAINSFLDQRNLDGTDSWVLFLDADILLLSNPHPDIANLNPKGLYSIKRRMCETEQEWRKLCAGQLCVDDLPLYVPEVVNGKVWKHRPTNNSAALCGYFQLWHITNAIGMKRMPPSSNASSYDVLFAFSFPEALRLFIEGREVLHLGPRKTNWDGRVSPRWNICYNSSQGFTKNREGNNALNNM